MEISKLNIGSSFFNHENDSFQESIWIELKNGLFNKIDVENIYFNNSLSLDSLNLRKNIFPNITVISPGTKFNYASKKIEQKCYAPKIGYYDQKKLIKSFEFYFKKFEFDQIVVHLSGGLDSSIIICLLNLFQIPFKAVGLVSDRFEFRTERIIQNKLIKYCNDVKLINMDNFIPYSNLKSVRISQTPNLFFNQIEATNALAKECKRFNANTVFTGQGGDSLFVNEIPENGIIKFNIENEFILQLEKNTIYPFYGMKLVSPYADLDIINAITSMRIGQKNDPLKIWARQTFQNILPNELVDYTFCADYFGYSLEGLHAARTDIKEIFDVAFEVSEYDIFSPKAINLFLEKDVFNFNYHSYINYLNRISIGLWFYNWYMFSNNLNQSIS